MCIRDRIQEQFNLGMKNTVELLTEKSNLLSAQQETDVYKRQALHLAGICQDTKVQAETPPPSPQKAEKGMSNTLFT